MAYQTDETVYIETGNGAELELDIEANWQRAEPDVGINQDYVDDYTITAVNGNVRRAPMVERIVSRSRKLDELIREKMANL